MFIPYYNSSADHERTRAIDSTVLVLSVYAENAADCILGVNILSIFFKIL